MCDKSRAVLGGLRPDVDLVPDAALHAAEERQALALQVVVLPLEEVRLSGSHGQLNVADRLGATAHAFFGLFTEISRHLLLLLVHLDVVLKPHVTNLERGNGMIIQ